jgi:translation elongation factor EF-1alpha
VGVNLQNVKCKQVPRGTVLSEKYNTPAKDLDYAVGFFLTVNYKGELKTGMELFFVNNRISRRCRIKVESQIIMNSDVLIDKLEVNEIKSKEIAFLAIYPVDPLVLDDPYEFPEFGLVQLWDNCQTVAIGKLFKLFKKGEQRIVINTPKTDLSRVNTPRIGSATHRTSQFDKRTAFADLSSARS